MCKFWGPGQSILDLLASFNADAIVIAKVRASLGGTAVAGSVTSTAVRVFETNLMVGSIGSKVKILQMFLNAHGYLVAPSGPGSSGKETTIFGPATRRAVIRFQEKYSSDILFPAGLSKGTGFVGPLTLKKMNELYGQ